MNDNDGVPDNSGETQLLKVLDSAYRPLLLGSTPGYQSATFVHINDHHSHYDEQSLDLRSSATIPPGLSVLATSNLRVYYGGFDRAMSTLEAEEDPMPLPLVFVTTLSTLLLSEAALRTLK